MCARLDSVKTTVDIPEEALEEAIRLTKAKTKKQAIVTAIIEFNRRRKLDWIRSQLGTFEDVPTQDELQQMRRDEHRS